MPSWVSRHLQSGQYRFAIIGCPVQKRSSKMKQNRYYLARIDGACSSSVEKEADIDVTWFEPAIEPDRDGLRLIAGVRGKEPLFDSFIIAFLKDFDPASPIPAAVLSAVQIWITSVQ